MFLSRSLSGLGACLLSSSALPAQTGKRIQIRGAYGSPKTFWEKGHRLNDYGINAVFVHSGAIDEALVRRARERQTTAGRRRIWPGNCRQLGRI